MMGGLLAPEVAMSRRNAADEVCLPNDEVCRLGARARSACPTPARPEVSSSRRGSRTGRKRRWRFRPCSSAQVRLATPPLGEIITFRSSPHPGGVLMPLSARDVLAAIIGVQKNLIKPEEVALAIAANQPPGDHLGVKWDKLTDEAEDRLAVIAPRDPAAPAAPPRQKAATSGGGSLVLTGLLGVFVVLLAIGLVVAGVAWVSATRQRDEMAAKLAQSEKSDQEAREQGALARKAVTEVF